jgi:hypothetical protein
MSRAKSGGGITSKNLVHKPVRTGAERRHIQKAGVAQIGQMQGNHTTDMGATRYKGVDLVGPKQPISVKLGNEVAATTVCGAGGSREVMRSGSQGMTGAPAKGNPPPAGNALAGWERK